MKYEIIILSVYISVSVMQKWHSCLNDVIPSEIFESDHPHIKDLFFTQNENSYRHVPYLGLPKVFDSQIFCDASSDVLGLFAVSARRYLRRRGTPLSTIVHLSP